ncbi:TPA: DUF551 domain-containing protein [Enterobacter hormaechei]|nr:DUF551 domain-containing protein [Enterobacter hormaechei]HBL8874986.1 DUF551 domain-containing protein [Enterobacter hormaechei]HBL8902343.1 DUF551 domain-containing protein [Enterobacter hormaechei]HBL8915758.1 DUF551 domain-containing protein [Enterobacter hormaechei]HBL8943107.1 DUF551 domain-containing protein [Enterobacter hormaechei]
MALAAMKLALASLEAKAMTQVLSSRAGNDTSTIDKALPEGTMLYTAPPAPVSVPDLKEFEAILDWILMLPCPTPKATHFAKRLAVVIDTCRAAMLHGAEPVSNRDELTDGWVACSKRMPSPSTGVIVAAPWQSAPGGYAMKWATNCPGHPDADIDGWIIPGASWSPTHWMPLPAAPQQEDIIC